MEVGIRSRNEPGRVVVVPSMTRFAITYDYRCPFARNANEHVVTALKDGAPYEVDFVPFSLGQVHVEEGQPDVWDDPAAAPGLLAVEASLAVRKLFPERFLDAHIALFAARHDKGRDLRDPEVIKEALSSVGVDADSVLKEVNSGWTKDEFHKAHDAAVANHNVFGVPTFILEEPPSAVFVRLMSRPNGDARLARETIDRVLNLISSHPDINELKHTTIPR
jgi:hypothetical protein